MCVEALFLGSFLVGDSLCGGFGVKRRGYEPEQLTVRRGDGESGTRGQVPCPSSSVGGSGETQGQVPRSKFTVGGPRKANLVLQDKLKLLGVLDIDFEFRTSTLEYPISNIEHRTSYIEMGV